MPTIVDKKLAVLSIPKTGSTSTINMLRRGVGLEKARKVGRTHHTLEQSKGYIPKNMPTFVIVRKPHKWLQSVWAEAHVHQDTCPVGPEVDYDGDFPDFQIVINRCWSQIFTEFIENYLSIHPGWVSEYFGKFVKGGHDVKHFVGHMECLIEDLQRILYRFGISFNDKKMRDVGYMNRTASTPEYINQVVYPDELLGRVFKVEEDIYQTYYNGAFL